jgi:hypothetical protein
MSEGKAANIEHQQQQQIGFHQQQQTNQQHSRRQGGRSNHHNDGGEPLVRPSQNSDTTTPEVNDAVGTGIAATPRTYQQQHFNTPDIRVYLKHLVRSYCTSFLLISTRTAGMPLV